MMLTYTASLPSALTPNYTYRRIYRLQVAQDTLCIAIFWISLKQPPGFLYISLSHYCLFAQEQLDSIKALRPNCQRQRCFLIFGFSVDHIFGNFLPYQAA